MMRFESQDGNNSKTKVLKITSRLIVVCWKFELHVVVDFVAFVALLLFQLQTPFHSANHHKKIIMIIALQQTMLHFFLLKLALVFI